MIDFGKSPVIPIEPSTTMTIGAMARIGIVWDEMIQGMRLRSSVRTCTMRTASTMPSRAPIAKPTRVEDRVTQAWNRRLRRDVIGVSTTVFFSSTRIWCGAGSIGRSCSSVAARISPPERCSPARSNASAVPCQFMRTAATYHSARIARTTTSTGPAFPSHRRETARRAGRAGRAIASVDIRMSGPQALADAVGDLQEFGRFADFELAHAAETGRIDHVDDAPRSRRHDDDLG